MHSLDEKITRAWYTGANWLYLLWPLSVLFSCIIRLRKWCYHSGLCKTYRSSVPVIVVGNIALGGTGKSPLVCHLVDALKAQGYRPGIVSRGYGASLDGAEVREVLSDSLPGSVGDEPLMLKRRLGCPVFVSPNRVAAVKMLEQAGCNIIVSDDGLQHYALARDIEICVFDRQRKWGNGHLMPMGPLREPISRIKDVSFVVLNGPQETKQIESVLSGAVTMTLATQNAIRLDNDAVKSLNDFASERVHAVAAIGHPERFFRTLEQAGIRVDRHPFADHHAFKREDFMFEPQQPIMMTEKDAVKCQTFALNDAWYVPVQANLNADLTAMIINKLTQQRRL